MKRSAEIRDLLVPWAGLIVGFTGWAFTHQFGADGTFDHCATISPGLVLVVAVVCIVAIVAAALSSWRVARDESQGAARRLIATISVGAAALFVVAMLLPMVAALVIPPCFG